MDIRLWDLTINREDHLVSGGCDLVDLARTYGTPLHVVDGRRLRRNYSTFAGAFQTGSPGARVFFSYKTNCVPGLLTILHEQGCGAEVASPYELWLATELGVPAASIIYNGVSRSVEDFERAIRIGVRLINIDSAGEAHRLTAAAQRLQTRVRVGVRADPGVGWNAHFGAATRSGQLHELAAALSRSRFVHVCAVHAHIGSCIREPRVYQRAVERVCRWAAAIKRSLAIEIDTLDVGGGFGVPTVKRFTARDAALYRLLNRPPRPPTLESCPSLERFADAITTAVKACSARHGIRAPNLVLEPGRALTGDAQILLVTVRDVKTRADGRRFAITDGGVQNVAFPLSYEYHHCLLASRASAAAAHPWFVTGPLCSPEDLLYRHWPLPTLETGDVLAIMDAGAYFTSFANNFSYPRPAVVLASDGKTCLVRGRESFDAMTASDTILEQARSSRLRQPPA